MISLSRLSKTLAAAAALVSLLAGCVGCGGPVPGAAEFEGEGIYVRAPDGTTHYTWDAYPAGERGNSSIIDFHIQPNQVFTVAPGHYDVTLFSAPGYTLASDVVVHPGEVTIVELGAIHVVRVAGADATWDLWPANGAQALVGAIVGDDTFVAPAGSFDVKKYFNANLEFAADVEVVPGRVSTVTLGAVQYGADKFDIYSGGELVSAANNPGEPASVQPGDYTLKLYYSDEVIATVHVDAGQLVVVP